MPSASPEPTASICWLLSRADLAAAATVRWTIRLAAPTDSGVEASMPSFMPLPWLTPILFDRLYESFAHWVMSVSNASWAA